MTKHIDYPFVDPNHIARGIAQSLEIVTAYRKGNTSKELDKNDGGCIHAAIATAFTRAGYPSSALPRVHPWQSPEGFRNIIDGVYIDDETWLATTFDGRWNDVETSELSDALEFVSDQLGGTGRQAFIHVEFAFVGIAHVLNAQDIDGTVFFMDGRRQLAGTIPTTIRFIHDLEKLLRQRRWDDRDTSGRPEMSEKALDLFLNGIDPNPPIRLLVVDNPVPNIENERAIFRLRRALSQLPPTFESLELVRNAAIHATPLPEKTFLETELDGLIEHSKPLLVTNVGLLPDAQFLIVPFTDQEIAVFPTEGRWVIASQLTLSGVEEITCSQYPSHPIPLELGTRLLERHMKSGALSTTR